MDKQRYGIVDKTGKNIIVKKTMPATSVLMNWHSI